MSKTIHYLNTEDLKPTSIESEVPGLHKVREATHDIEKPSDIPVTEAETATYDLESYIPVITQTKEKENPNALGDAGVFKVVNPTHSCIHGELVPGPHTLRQVPEYDQQGGNVDNKEDRRDDQQRMTHDHKDDKTKGEEFIKEDFHEDEKDNCQDKKKEDTHDEGKKPKTRIPVSKFKQAAERVKEKRRSTKKEMTPETKPLIKVQPSSIRNPQHTGPPSKPPRLNIDKNKIPPKGNHPKPLNEKVVTNKNLTKSDVGNKRDDKHLKNLATSKLDQCKDKSKATNDDKPHVDELELKDEFKKHEINNANLLKLNETETNIKPSEVESTTLAKDHTEKIHVEDEFEKLYEEIVDPAEVDLDNSLLNNKIDDPEKLESKFEDIIHAYDDHDQFKAEEEKCKSKIPLLKRRSEHEIIVPTQIRRFSLKNPPSVEKVKVNNPFKRNTDQNEVKKEIPTLKPTKKQSETTKEKKLSRFSLLRKVKEQKKEDNKQKHSDIDQSQTKEIKSKSEEAPTTKELEAEPKDIIEETIPIRDFTQPKLRENKSSDVVEAKEEKETINKEKYEAESPKKEMETINQDKEHDRLEHIPKIVTSLEKVDVNDEKPHEILDDDRNNEIEAVDSDISSNYVQEEFNIHLENNKDEEENVDPAKMDDLQYKPLVNKREDENTPIHTTDEILPVVSQPEVKPETEPILNTDIEENVFESNNIEEPNKPDETIVKVQETNKRINDDLHENSKDSESQTKEIKSKPEKAPNTKELEAEPKNIIEETIPTRDFTQPKLRENKSSDIVETKVEKETSNKEKYEAVSPKNEMETINQDKGLDGLEHTPQIVTSLEKVDINDEKPHETLDDDKNNEIEAVDSDISSNYVQKEFDKHLGNKKDEEENVDPAKVDDLQYKPPVNKKEDENASINATDELLPDIKHLPQPEDKPDTKPILKTDIEESESNNIEEPSKPDETIEKVQETKKRINDDLQENIEASKVPEDIIRESEVPETGHTEYTDPEEESNVNKMEQTHEISPLNKKEKIVEGQYIILENKDDVLFINKQDHNEKVCEKQDKPKEVSTLDHKIKINEAKNKHKDSDELNEKSFLNENRNVNEESSKDEKQLDDEEISPLKGKVSNIINEIHSNKLSHVEIKKEEQAKEKPKKRSILSKIAMFERKASPVQKRTHPQPKDIQTHHIQVVDFSKSMDKPSVVGEVLKPIERELILKKEINQDSNQVQDIVDNKQPNFEQPKHFLITEDIREHVSTIYDNKNDESDKIIKEKTSDSHENKSIINRDTKVKVKPIKFEKIPKTEKLKVTSILKSRDLNAKPSPSKFKQDSKESKTTKRANKRPSLETIEKNPREQDPKIIEKVDEKLNKDFEPNTTRRVTETYDPEFNKLPNEDEGKNIDKQNAGNESLTNDVFENNETDMEVEIINVVQRKPKKREERPKSVAEIDLGDAVKGIVHKMIVRMNSTEILNVEKKEIINIKERPRKKSVSEKIELFEKKLTLIKTEEVRNKETYPKSKKNDFIEEKQLSEEECKKIIDDLKNAKFNYGRVTEMVYLDLNNGHMMPVLNIGTALLDNRLIPHVIGAAIDLGYRGIDAAYIYGNEKEVGEAIQAKIKDGTVTREDLFITSKLWNTYHRPDLVAEACRNSLQAMGLEYFDLYLIHSPMSFKEGKDPTPKIANVIQYSEFDYMDAWYAMEELVSDGLVRSIGVSNFNSIQIARVVEKSRIKPVINQVECHPYLTQRNLDDFCNSRDVMLSCFGTLGAKGTPRHLKTSLQPVIDDPLVKVMAAGLNITPAQMLIRYQIENRRTVVVGASGADHLWSNLQTLKMSLDSRQMDALDALNRNKRIYDYKGMGDTHKNYPFNKPF